MTSKVDQLLIRASNFEKSAKSLTKKAESNPFYHALMNYENLSQAIPDIAEGWRMVAENYKNETDFSADPNAQKIYDLFLKESATLESSLPQLQAIESEINRLISTPEESF